MDPNSDPCTTKLYDNNGSNIPSIAMGVSVTTKSPHVPLQVNTLSEKNRKTYKSSPDKLSYSPLGIKTLVPKPDNFKPIMAASISGGCFPHQLSIMRKLARSGCSPYIALGSSGGNVSLYLCAGGKWTPCGINRIAKSLNQSLFVEPWYPFITGWVPESLAAAAGYFKGSIYRSSNSGLQLFNSYFAPGDITNIETWVGAVNESTGSIALFGNRCREHSIIKGNHFDRRMFKSEPLKWLCGDTAKIHKAMLASSSVPAVIQPQEIDGEKYVDGGVKFASPLSPLKNEIKAIAKSNDYSIHIIYVSGYDIESDIAVTPLNNMLDHGKVTGSHIVRAMVMHDRDAAKQIIEDISSSCINSEYVCRTEDGDAKIHFIDVESRAINAVYERLHLTKCCLFELYPTNPDILNYTKFTGDDVLCMMNKTDNAMAGRLWWSGDFNIFQGIDGVICNLFSK